MSSKVEGLFAKSFLLLEISFQTPFILVNHSVRQTIFYFGILSGTHKNHIKLMTLQAPFKLIFTRDTAVT